MLENFPYDLWSPWYEASTDSVYFYYVGHWDEGGTYTTYMKACDLLDQYTTTQGVHTGGGPCTPVTDDPAGFIGNYIEGSVYVFRAYIMQIN